MDALERIGERIRTTRRSYMLTQEQLAELAGTSTRTVRDIERGTGSTGIGTVAEVAATLGLRLEIGE